MATDAPLLERIAAEYGTPAYVYDLDMVRQRLAELVRALPEARVRYAAKANPNRAVLETVAAAGHGVEAITRGELQRAVAAGIRPDRIVVGGPAQDSVLRREALAAGVAHVSLDSESQWEDWQETLAQSPSTVAPAFLVRVNPDLDPRTHEHLATGAGDSKFGVSPEAAGRLATQLKAAGCFAGFHVHAGSQLHDLEVFRAVLAVLEPLCSAHQGSVLDFGGGYRVPGFPLEGYAALLREFTDRHGLGLIIEPGRWLVADAGVLLTRVLHVKPGKVTHVIADAGMADLLRPALYGAVHPIATVGADPSRAVIAVDVDGPLCENGDRLGRNVMLPEPRKGDLLQVGQAGAYGMGMASNYASSLRPAEVAVSGGVARLVRRRETTADLLARESD